MGRAGACVSSSECSASVTLKSARAYCTFTVSPGVHGSSCKALLAAVLLRAFGIVLKDQKIMTSRKVQPRWLVLAAEREEGLPVR